MAVYTKCAQSVWAAGIDYLSHTIKCALFGTTFVQGQNTHRYFSELTGEISGTGYTAGGVTLTGKTLTPGTGTVVLDCDNPSWANMTATGIQYVVFYRDTGTPSSSPLISYFDLGTTYSPSGQPVTVVVSPSGLLANNIVLG